MRYCLALDLIDDETLIAEYEQRHQRIWPEVRDHLRQCGVIDMEIFRLGTRLTMVLDVDEQCFSFEAMAEAERQSSIIQQWEDEMGRYQRPTPWTEENNKWQLMKPIFQLAEQ